jgi:NAD(P)-dependent dehydrogenase (short-subunit alcohol dehydrogenase family)
MIDDLRGRTAVVTGAASGIGLALCETFVAEGMRVVMSDVDPDRLLAAAARLESESGAELLAVATDVSSYEAVEALRGSAIERFGAVDVLCNNAGVTVPGLTWELTLEEWKWILDVNLWGVIHGLKAFLPDMIARGEPAHVVNTASIGGLMGFPRLSPYSAAKFGVVGLSESLCLDLRASGAAVGVSVLCPGATATGFRRNSAALRPGAAARDFDDNGAVRVPPAGVARQVVDAIRRGRFWIVTTPEYREVLDRRHHGLVESDEVVTPPVL